MKYQLSLLLGLVSSLAFAQQGGIGAVKIEPNPAKAGQEVKITIAAEGETPTFCGMVVHFDDGSESRQIKIDSKDAKFPVTITKTYAKAGSYFDVHGGSALYAREAFGPFAGFQVGWMIWLTRIATAASLVVDTGLNQSLAHQVALGIVSELTGKKRGRVYSYRRYA